MGLLLSLVRKGTVDAIAILAMVALAMDTAAALLVPTVGIALVVPSPDGALIGLALVISALIGPPRSRSWVAKPLVAGGSDRAATLNKFIESHRARTFFTIALV